MTGQPIVDREARAGDKYARPPIPYHYGGYVHRADSGLNAEQRLAKEREERHCLDRAVFDLSQTTLGRERLTFAYTHNLKIVHDDQYARDRGANAVNVFVKGTSPAETVRVLYLGSETNHLDLQTRLAHEGGHALRNDLDLLYNSSDTFNSAIVTVRAQEASSIGDEAQHAAECELIANPDHYKPQGVMERFKARNPDIGEVAEKSAHFIAEGRLDKFRQNAHIAFYTPENLAYYDLQVIKNYKSWVTPPARATCADPKIADPFQRHMQIFMSDNYFNHEKLTQVLPYLKGAEVSLDEPWTRALTNDPRVVKAYGELVGQIEPLMSRTPHRPQYRHFFMDEVAPARVEASPAMRMLESIGASRSGQGRAGPLVEQTLPVAAPAIMRATLPLPATAPAAIPA